MHKGTNSKNSKRSKQINILIGYNLPFVFWTAAVFFMLFSKGTSLWQCPADKWLGFCPGCGLSHSYVRLLRGEGIDSIWFALVFALLIGNTIYSFYKAFKKQSEEDRI